MHVITCMENLCTHHSDITWHHGALNHLQSCVIFHSPFRLSTRKYESCALLFFPSMHQWPAKSAPKVRNVCGISLSRRHRLNWTSFCLTSAKYFQLSLIEKCGFFFSIGIKSSLWRHTNLNGAYSVHSPIIVLKPNTWSCVITVTSHDWTVCWTAYGGLQ